MMSKHDWLDGYRLIASAVEGLTSTGDRFPEVMALLDRCDEACQQNDWNGFLVGAQAVMTALAST